jgi:hypothetical protein
MKEKFPYNLGEAIDTDVKEIDLALAILNSLRDVNIERLKLIGEAKERE